MKEEKGDKTILGSKHVKVIEAKEIMRKWKYMGEIQIPIHQVTGRNTALNSRLQP